MKRENQLALGLVLILLGLLILAFSNVTVNALNYSLRSGLDNSNTANESVSVSGNFTVGEHFLFNITKGHYWGVKYDVENGGLEPVNSEFAPNASIPAYKIVTFDVHTPSDDVFVTEMYVVGGTDPYAVVFDNQSSDFLPVSGDNLTLFPTVGIEGIIARSGEYTVKATAIVPTILRTQNLSYTIDTDPPLLMNMWVIQSSEQKPYFVLALSSGAVLVLSGIVLSAQAALFKKKPARRSRA